MALPADMRSQAWSVCLKPFVEALIMPHYWSKLGFGRWCASRLDWLRTLPVFLALMFVWLRVSCLAGCVLLSHHNPNIFFPPASVYLKKKLSCQNCSWLLLFYLVWRTTFDQCVANWYILYPIVFVLLSCNVWEDNIYDKIFHHFS